MLLWDRPLTPRDQSHTLRPGPREYVSIVRHGLLNELWVALQEFTSGRLRHLGDEPSWFLGGSLQLSFRGFLSFSLEFIELLGDRLGSREAGYFPLQLLPLSTGHRKPSPGSVSQFSSAGLGWAMITIAYNWHHYSTMSNNILTY